MGTLNESYHSSIGLSSPSSIFLTTLIALSFFCAFLGESGLSNWVLECYGDFPFGLDYRELFERFDLDTTDGDVKLNSFAFTVVWELLI